ncbi:FecR family protein [Corticimicrobacter populi]|uniref:Iron dicitrate transport regulator FecR n=1 Tax=Corticimicrobacter populi TaxID=2175229 RepID=A0A2V1JTE4_9BURK|nr:FecR domain-containing protein [Corticimicrobacter populi]PWF20892.1 hypothetical protein DD235_16335 [Corticimicrobacter populi]
MKPPVLPAALPGWQDAVLGVELDAAIEWRLRLDDSMDTEHAMSVRLEFEHWLQASPAHFDAWSRLDSGLDRTMGPLRSALAGPDGGLRNSLLHPERMRRRFMRRALALGAAGSGLVWLAHRQVPLPNLLADLGTGTAQRQRHTLPDGSDILLDARSRIDLAFDGRQRLVHLLAGAIQVRTGTDAARPFLVATAQGQVQALGTEFMVRQETGASQVLVQRDRVRVRAQFGGQVDLQAGQGVRFRADGIDAIRTDMQGDSAWQDGLLEVNDRALPEVIDALRAYYPGVLRVSPAVAEIRVSGVFPLDDPMRALRALAHTTPIEVRRYTPWVTLVHHKEELS